MRKVFDTIRSIIKKPITYVLIGLTWSIVIEKLVFDFSHMATKNLLFYMLAKVILMLSIYLFVNWVEKMVIRIKQKDYGAKVFLIVFTVTFVIYILVTCLAWPGNWNVDEVFIYLNIIKFDVLFAQGYFTNLFYMISLMLIPTIGGIVIFQSFFFSIIAAYIVQKIVMKYGKYGYLSLLIFLNIQTIYLAITPLRASMTVFLGLLFFESVLSNRRFEGVQIYIWALFMVILGFSRPEMFWFIVLGMGYILFDKTYKARQKANFVLVCGILIFGVLLINSFYDRDERREKLITSFPVALNGMIKESDIREEREWQYINKVLDLQVINEMESWRDFFKANELFAKKWPVSDETYRNFMVGVSQLTLKYPIHYIKAKLPMFYASIGVSREWAWVSMTEDLEKLVRSVSGEKYLHRFSIPFPESRSYVLSKIITGLDSELWNIKLYYFYWNQAVILISVFLASFVLLIRLNRNRLITLFAYWGFFTMVYLTFPVTWEMYFLPSYVWGILILVLLILEYFISENNVKPNIKRM